ncbi:hypothetical protein DID80_08455 [Candidatus Marinamargulisbacteria bacterium SCGC AAA071-K20]|nr:hypothetical protein DID80_08455 [Candidatus Marinamargulisbacteria bacterium SCGC AAA071-K20]
MEYKYKLSALPKHSNQQVKIKEKAKKRRVVIRFSGRANDVEIREKEQESFK